MTSPDARDYCPRLRAIEIISTEADEGPLLVLRDPFGIAEGPAALPLNALTLLCVQSFDGSTSLGELQQKIEKKSGAAIPLDVIETFARKLEDLGYMEGEAFERRRVEQRTRYEASDERPPSVYKSLDEEGVRQLREILAGCRSHPLGPDGDHAEIAAIARWKGLGIDGPRMLGAFAPHIDYERGGFAYAWAYEAIARATTEVDTFVILGTIHRPMDVQFSATRKAYRTPFGRAEVDHEFLDELDRRLEGLRLLGDEFAHAAEHSIELQVIYLQHALAGRERPWRIVPILIDSFHEEVESGRSPRKRSDVVQFIEALRELIEDRAPRVFLIGGVDFSHIGPRFGGKSVLRRTDYLRTAHDDMDMLEAVTSLDPERFFDTFVRDNNARNVCSIAPMYCMLSVLEGSAHGLTLRYGQAPDPDGQQCVSFAGVAFMERSNGDSED